MKTHFLIALLALSVLLLSSCATTQIGRIIADPYRYHNRDVRIEGTVTSSVDAFVAGAYQVQDATGKIYVLSSHGVPSKGVHVRVEGNVAEGVSIMGKSFGTALRERDHKVRF